MTIKLILHLIFSNAVVLRRVKKFNNKFLNNLKSEIEIFILKILGILIPEIAFSYNEMNNYSEDNNCFVYINEDDGNRKRQRESTSEDLDQKRTKGESSSQGQQTENIVAPSSSSTVPQARPLRDADDSKSVAIPSRGNDPESSMEQD
jgi:hypothetical protein